MVIHRRKTERHEILVHLKDGMVLRRSFGGSRHTSGSFEVLRTSTSTHSIGRLHAWSRSGTKGKEGSVPLPIMEGQRSHDDKSLPLPAASAI